MFDIKETKEPYPQILREFKKNNPNMNHESLYLCETVDMDGNVVDTKIGVNLLTNYGLSDNFVYGNGRRDAMYIWLGSGSSQPDPASASLTTYISNLGGGSGYTQYYSAYPREFDSTNNIWSCQMKISQMYWDYTAGGNSEYEIWEIGVGHSQTALRTHALIYDEHGTQTCIVKRPNTRLYVTVYWTGSISVSDIPTLYNDGYYVLIDPIYAIPNRDWECQYWSLLTRGILYNKRSDPASDSGELSNFRFDIRDYTSIVSGDPRKAHYESGPSNTNQKFWEDNIFYMSGWYVSTNDSWDTRYQDSIHEISYAGIMFQDPMTTTEDMESYWAYSNSSFNGIFVDRATYTGSETESWDLFCIDKNFGWTCRDHQGNINWDYPYGILPCTNFDITELCFYNYTTKEWDISIPHKNEPNTIYDDSWEYVFIRIPVIYNGNPIDAKIYANRYPHDSNGVPIPAITAFNNTGITMVATDSYWDPSTYVEITTLNNVPSALQHKRYYIIISGNAVKLEPVISHSDAHHHELQPTTPPYELTKDVGGKIPRIPNYIAHTFFGDGTKYESDTFGAKPVFNNDLGYFSVSFMIHFVDQNDEWTTYNLLLDEKYPGCKFRRWNTRNGDKILIFGSDTHTDIPNGAPGSDTSSSQAYAANTFGVWSIVDGSTAPTIEQLTMVWSDPTVVNNSNSYHLYSWSDLGYLVAAKRRIETEFIWVDVYDANGASMHLVTNAKHARVIERTTYVVYQDMLLSENGKYVFQVYDMASDSIYDTITIEDGNTYEIKGVFGYNEHVYIKAVSSNVTSTFYYNLNNKSMEKLDWNLLFMESDHVYRTYQTLSCEECCIVTYTGDRVAVVINGNTYKNLFNTDTTHGSTERYNVWPCLNKLNDGKQYILTITGAGNHGFITMDFGLYLDGDTRYTNYNPFRYYEPTDRPEYDPEISGPILPFKDGIIKVCGDRRSALYHPLTGRMFWFPLEMCLPMYIKGTTRTLNSYNAPIRWSLDKKISWDITNDLSRLLPT